MICRAPSEMYMGLEEREVKVYGNRVQDGGKDTLRRNTRRLGAKQEKGASSAFAHKIS